MKLFKVYITHTYTYEIPIEAENAAEAHNLACEFSPAMRKQYTTDFSVRMDTTEEAPM